ncbi:MAG: Arc family DNA-binding protein, partial [Wenzhouxiangella sp.]|nr:Arc family DNA-binding protein [Wenzhouxiangella sp.]
MAVACTDLRQPTALPAQGDASGRNLKPENAHRTASPRLIPQAQRNTVSTPKWFRGIGFMSTSITLKNIPDPIYQRIKQATKRHHRSMNNEIIACLEQ